LFVDKINNLKEFLKMQQNTSKAPVNKKKSPIPSSKKPTTNKSSNMSNKQNTSPSVESFAAFQKQAQNFSNTVTNLMACNANSNQWNDSYNRSAKEFSNLQNYLGTFSQNLLDAITNAMKSSTSCITTAQNLNCTYYNSCADIAERTAKEATASAQNAFGCSTLDQYLGWLQQNAEASRNSYNDYMDAAVNSSVKYHKDVYQTASREAQNLQDRVWKAWTKCLNSCLTF
jgi:hypothetical protein